MSKALLGRIALGLAAAAAIVVLIVLATENQSTRTVTVTTLAPGAPHQPPPDVTFAQHPCTPENWYMQCAYNAAGQQLNYLPGGLLGFAGQFGLDFAWARPPGSLLASTGVKFAVSYLSGTSKDWTYANLHDLIAHKIAVGFVWETTAARALAGCAAGRYDAQRADALLGRYGIGHSPAIYLAVDTDVSAAAVAPYIGCAHAVLGNRTGVYGGYSVVSGLMNRGVVHYCWQTLAWSYGRWDVRCQLQQTSINHTWYGYSVDYDRRTAANAGLYPPPNPGPSPAQVTHWRGARNASFAAYHARGCKLGTDTRNHCNVYAGRVTYFQRKLWTKYPRWHCWGGSARTKTAVCWIVRPEVASWSRKRKATERAYLRNACDGPASFPRPVHTPLCNRLRQRRAWFDARVRETMRAY